MSSPFVRWAYMAYTLGCILPLSKGGKKMKKVKVLNLVVGGWRCIICCRRELAETVAALQQRRLLAEAKEYTLSIKVLGQLGPQPSRSRCFSGEIPSCPTKKGGFDKVSGKFAFGCFCACTEGQVKNIYLEIRPWFLPTKSSTSFQVRSAKKLKPKTNHLEKNILLSFAFPKISCFVAQNGWTVALRFVGLKDSVGLAGIYHDEDDTNPGSSQLQIQKKLDHFPNNSRHSTDPVYSHMLILWNLLCLDCVSLLVLDFSFPTKPYLSRPEKRRQTSNLIYAWRTLARSRGHAARHGAQWR